MNSAKSGEKEIPALMAHMEKQIAALEESIGVLASSIAQVTSQGLSRDEKSPPEVKSHRCDLSEKLDMLTDKVMGARLRVESLTERVQL